MLEKTLVLLKPDAVETNLIGEIIKRYEEAGMKIAALKMLTADEETLSKHYSDDPAYVESLGDKSLENYAQQGLDPVEILGTDDAYEIGKMVRQWLINSMSSGPIVAMILEGEGAIKKVRAVTGSTIPANAEKGTIRGDLGDDDAVKANREKRSVYNLVHASANKEEAGYEIKLWFPEFR